MTSAILTWHSLDESGSPISISPRRFRDQLDALRQAGVRIVPLSEVLHHNDSVALTFDDGFQNFHKEALPFLVDRKLPATLFVVNQYVGKTNHWPTQPAGVPELPLLDWSQIDDARRAGVEIAAHTATHPLLYRLSHLEQVAEIVQAKEHLEDRLGQSVVSFAYPYGATDARSRSLVEEHFHFAVTTNFQYTDAASTPLQLPRIDVRSLGHPVWLSGLFQGVGRTWVGVRRLARVVRSIA